MRLGLLEFPDDCYLKQKPFSAGHMFDAPEAGFDFISRVQLEAV
jgi:hypothetical protein